jgi:hypothetical protein
VEQDFGTRPVKRCRACGKQQDAYRVRVDQTPDLNDALARLKAFRATWNLGETIDEESGLTANDIDVVTSFVDDFPSSD